MPDPGVRVPDERLDELAASIESLMRRPGQPVADHFRAASAAASLAALVADLRAGRAEIERLREIEAAARAFVVTTNTFGQPHRSRSAFGDLTFALAEEPRA